jgi:hypothetical protein
MKSNKYNFKLLRDLKYIEFYREPVYFEISFKDKVQEFEVDEYKLTKNVIEQINSFLSQNAYKVKLEIDNYLAIEVRKKAYKDYSLYVYDEHNKKGIEYEIDEHFFLELLFIEKIAEEFLEKSPNFNKESFQIVIKRVPEWVMQK